MEQKSDVEYRAEKLYKNSREKFGYLIREVVSNAIHAVIIRKNLNQQEGYIPRVEFAVTSGEGSVEIVVKDNGEGFNQSNCHYFTHLDTKNSQKEKLHFHPQGQGRLSVVFFSDKANYSSIYMDDFGVFQRRTFDYPEKSMPLFDVEELESSPTDEKETGTVLKLAISKQQTYGRAKTFITSYPDIEKLSDWFIENFFPFFIEYEDLVLALHLNGYVKNINRTYIEKKVESIPFSVDFGEIEKEKNDFKIWLVEKSGKPRSRNPVSCFAHHLRAELEGARLEYEIDLPLAYDWLLTSEYFDDNVDQKGDKIEIDDISVEKIQSALNSALDKHFSIQIENNRKKNKCNIADAKNRFHSLSPFIGDAELDETKRVLDESDIVNKAIEVKGRVEKAYWTDRKVDDDDVDKLLNSSLQIYIKHRSKILERFKELIQKFDYDGEVKNESEEEVHDLFLHRGKTLKESNNINHLHNLWILDDKYTIFSETRGAVSSRRGQEASDIYIWADDLESTKELLILELKSTTAAHNAGDKYESMVGQVKRYAAQFYRDPQKIINWSVDPDRILYSGVILARKSDVYKELNSNNSGAGQKKIPFLESSYYFNESFSIGSNMTAAPTFKDIRIEMYSYEDIYKLASDRNSVFFRLLKGEFKVESKD